MQIDQATAERLAKELGGTVQPVVSEQWLGPFPQPQEYKIVLPSGAVLDAGQVAYAETQADPGIPLQRVVGVMEITALAEGGAGLPQAVQQASVYQSSLPQPASPTQPVTAPQYTPEELERIKQLASIAASLGTPSLRPSPSPVDTTASGAPAETHAGTTGGTPMTSTPGYSPTTSVAESIKQAAGSPSALTPDEWNWYYMQVTGQIAPAPEDLGYTRPVSPVSFDEWFNRMQNYLRTTGTEPVPGVTEPGAPPAQAPPAGNALSQLAAFLRKLFNMLLYGHE